MKTDLYVMNADGSGETRLTEGYDLVLGPTWSPDGTRIAFAATVEGGDYEIYRVDADGANAVRLTDHPADDRAPHWSPVADVFSDLE